MKKLYLYWWNAKINVGDVASEYLVKKLYNGQVIRKDPRIIFNDYIRSILKKNKKSEYYIFPNKHYISAIGSIIDHLNNKAIIWGSGCRDYNSIIPLKAKYLLVRGEYTKNILLQKGLCTPNLPIGDPALILPLVFNPKDIEKKYNITIIPHYTDYEDISSLYSSKYHILDVRTYNVEYFVKQILESKLVISSSLHGLIFANAYGIPSLWFKNNYVNSSDFKYYDYFSSVELSNVKPIENIHELLNKIIDIDEILREYKHSLISPREIITIRQQGILDSWKELINMWNI